MYKLVDLAEEAYEASRGKKTKAWKDADVKTKTDAVNAVRACIKDPKTDSVSDAFKAVVEKNKGKLRQNARPRKKVKGKRNPQPKRVVPKKKAVAKKKEEPAKKAPAKKKAAAKKAPAKKKAAAKK